jgi:dTDP-glucose 4,6-dehydratase
MSTTLVTGGAGFIGSHLVTRLFDQLPSEKIIVLDLLTYAGRSTNIPLRIHKSDRFKFINGDINNRPLVEQLVGDSDRVVHLAAESHVTRSIAAESVFFRTNVMGTHVVAAAVAARKGKISKFVHISTSEVYGTHSTSGLAMDESHPLLPRSPYAASKAAADRMVYSYKATYDIPLVILRPFNNYGPRQHLEKVIPRFITSALSGRPMEVHGDGLMTRDWIYVEDTCEAILQALERNIDFWPGQLASEFVINLGTGIDNSVLHIATLISDALKPSLSQSPKIEHVTDRPGRVERHISSTTRAQQLLGFSAQKSLYAGIGETVAWYRDNPEFWADFTSSAVIDITDLNRGLAGRY